MLADYLCSPRDGGALNLRRTSARLFGACALLQMGVAIASELGMLQAVALLTVFGKMCTAGAMQINWLLPTEFFPPNLRSTGFGVASSCARVACIAVPAVARDLSLPVASLITVSLALSAAVTIGRRPRPTHPVAAGRPSHE